MSGSETRIRKATQADLKEVKRLADAHRYELGFVLRPALARSISKEYLLIAENGTAPMGFVDYNHRKDGQTTLYHIVVEAPYHRQGIGRRLFDALVSDARDQGQHFIFLKCPVDLTANHFYERIGCKLIRVDSGRSRKLNIWRIMLSP